VETVDWQLGEARRLGAELRHAMLGKDEAGEFWRAYHASETAAEWIYSLRVTALPADLGATLADVQRLLPTATVRAHAANGVARIHGGDDLLNELRPRHRHKLLTELREAAQARGGQVVILRAPQEIKHQLDVWGEPGATARLMRAIKQQYDPQHRLNHGRFVAGI